MIDYGNWKERNLSVTSLRLDPLNPRIPGPGTDVPQRELIADLVHHDRVYDLAKSIVEIGYLPGEAIIVIDEKNRRYVVEGNRRIVALKLLLSPEAAPEDFEGRFRALSTRIGSRAVRKVKAIVAPSRMAANLVVMHRHTESQVMKWAPPMQAKFFRNLVDSGLTVDDISDQYNVQASKVREALQRYTLYCIACSLDLPEEVSQTVRNPRKFKVTTLHRLHENPRVNEFLGISFDENTRLVGKIDPQEFRKAYLKIVADIANGEIDSRTVNKTEDMEKYLAGFGDRKPNHQKKGSFTAKTLLEKEGQDEMTAARDGGRRRAKKSTKPTALIPKTKECTLNSQRVNALFGELKKLNVAYYPNAVSLMLRGLLEMGLGYYLDRTGHLQQIIDAEKARRKKKGRSLPKRWHPTLDNMLKYISVDDDTIIQNPNLRTALGKLRSERENPISVDSLNLFVHNLYYMPDAEKLRRFWVRLEPLFDIILIEPEPDDTE